jgi:hypothetical protein
MDGNPQGIADIGPRVLTPPRSARWKHLGHPLLAPALLAALLASVAMLPLGGARVYGRWETTVLRLLPVLERVRPARRDPSASIFYYFVPGPDGRPRGVNSTDYSWDETSNIWKGDPAVWVGVNVDVRRIGWFAPTIENTRVEVRLEVTQFAPGDAWSEANLNSSREAFAAMLRDPAGKNRSDLAERFLAGNSVTARTIWWGVLWNYATLAALALLCVSVALQPAWWRGWVSKRRLRRGRCGTCAYDLSATAEDGGSLRCPECGSAWVPTGTR